MDEVIAKQELKTLLTRFCKDKNRGISVRLFCEFAGIGKDHLFRILYRDWVLSETNQIRLSKAYNAWHDGKIAVLKHHDRTVTAKYREKPQMFMRKHYSLRFDGVGGISLDTRPRIRGDYSGKPLFEDRNGKYPVRKNQKHR